MTLEVLRTKIDKINREIVHLLGERLKVAREIARIKKDRKLPILDAEREALIHEEIRRLAKEQNLSAPIVEEIFQLLLEYTRIEMEAVE
ncbi:MAG: chorismate mutase [Verrucomicrobia bacterium]|nr:chorismate mutase [Verrucomicrobiota bacterium]